MNIELGRLRFSPRAAAWATIAIVCVMCGTPARAQKLDPTPLKGVAIEQHLDKQLPLNLHFRDSTGARVQLGKYWGRKPVILTLVYFDCPMLCNQVLNGLTQSMRSLPFELGNEYEVVTVSFDPLDTPAKAARKQEGYLAAYGAEREGHDPKGWHFLTGDRESIAQLARAVGFQYRYDQATGQYAHASAIMVTTPGGKLSRYFYGIDYPPRDLRFAIIQASQSRIASPVDQVLLLCYHYDPHTGRYGVAIDNLLKIAGCSTIAVLAGFILLSARRDRKRQRALRSPTTIVQES